ncbi:PilZ domain-containing protein [Bacillus mexicanus]|uniref:PilZ domain-containing protein n=1 Tax=Bacillus mexicanus TaxID=2834415 RepID=UPI003D25ABC3
MQFHQTAEVITNDHRFLTNVKIVDYNQEKQELYTLIPRSLTGSPVPFSTNEEYNLIYSSYESIQFFKIFFKNLTQLDGKPVYEFSVKEYTVVENLRKEERKSVEYQAVVSDFNQIGIVTILDISYSGLRIETDYEIKAEFVEIFFDEENVPRRAMGQVCWTNFDKERKVYYHGINLKYR